MKQTYIAPKTVKIAIKTNHLILTSEGVNGSALGKEYTSTDVSYSRSNSAIWDDEE